MTRDTTDYSITYTDQCLVIMPPRELAYDMVPGFKAEVESHLTAPGLAEVVVDLSETVFLDSSGIGVLILIQKTASQEGFSALLRRPRQEVRKILGLVNLLQFFTIQD